MSLLGDVNQDDAKIEAKVAVLNSISSSDLAGIIDIYDTLTGTLSQSEGDFIVALKAQLAKEKALVMQMQQVINAIVTEIQNARSDFKSADQKYADSKIEK
ncbi:MAG: hypothetical protein ACI4SN_07375 [Lachnospiraceae bacterium]